MDSDVEYYYNDALRWTFGFDNPNKAAVIFACLFPLTWLLWSLTWKIKSPWFRWPGILFTSGIVLVNAFCLFKTYSRGGVVAALVGGLYLLWKSTYFDSGWLRGLHSGKTYAGSILGILLIVLFVWTGLGDRSIEPVTTGDASVGHRLVLWRSALEMAVDNPSGFGTGRSGETYMQWYEPLDMSASYRTMVNSYLTFLVEQGWLLSAFLLITFLVFWFWAIPQKSQSFNFEIIVGLRASIVAFLVTGLFSTVMEEPLLWIIPGICAGVLIVWCLLLRISLSLNKLLGASIGGLTVLACLFIGGISQRHFDPLTHQCGLMNGSQTVVEIGKRTPNVTQTWVVVPDKKILGDDYGKLLRQLVLQADIHLKIQDKTSPIPSDSPLLLVGEAVQATPISSSLPVVFLSPSIVPDGQAAQWVKSCPHLSMFLPGIDEDGRAGFWQNCADTAKLDQHAVNTLDGVGLRIDWAWPNVITLIKDLN
ncbi:MAG: O-antigen ligase family protein [Methylacidiphilales bacterium]|nr:O-antigen ligase family protein [Candidatus Methylacidiphilales bacterium]